jgi:hypothetical protein
MNELNEKSININDRTYLARSELIASLDRLLYELFTGDSSHRPLRLWKLWQLHDSLKINNWPYIDPTMMNTMTLAFEVPGWPLSQIDHYPYFVQTAAISYHYGVSAANVRQFLLSAFITPFHRQSLYTGCMSSVQRIIETIMVPEFHLFLKNGLTLLVQKESRLPDLTASNALCLKTMNNKIDQWTDKHPLSFRYYSYTTQIYCHPRV